MFALFLLLSTLCGVLNAADLKAPKFSSTYTAKGTLYIPYAEIREPFYAWYDENSGSSRIDYYGGMVKTFQLSNEGDYGSSIKIAPVTTETVVNDDTCLRVNGSSDSKIVPQTILPDTTGFECIGQEELDGLTVEKWRLVTKIEEKVNNYTLWIHYKSAGKSSIAKQPIPVMYEMRGFNSLLGSHYDHYYLKYEWFSFKKPSADVFKITENKTCVSFPGPGDKHIYTFNPMKEFVNNYDEHMEIAFNQFKKTHNRKYTNEKDHHLSKKHFRQNLRFIHSVNRKNLGYRLAVNHLADHSKEQMQALRGKQYTKIQYNGGLPFPHNIEEEIKSVPENFDWRLYGAVTPVKDQSVCGSCWSFGTTGAVEGAYFMKHHELVRLSQQALIDCSWGFGNNGCDGGEDFRSYQWIMKHGLPTEIEYGGYLGQDGYCHVSNVSSTVKMTGFVNVTTGNVDAMKLALFKHGPISVAIDASHKAFSFYANGVYYDPQCGNTEESLDHAVLAVGYGTMNGKGYWLVKNSWSTYWGNDGYILMAQKDNNCGVLTAPTYAIVE